MIKNNH